MRINGEFDNSHEEYERLKKEMEENIRNFQIRRSELEKESVNWTDLLERTFDFAELAMRKFQD